MKILGSMLIVVILLLSLSSCMASNADADIPFEDNTVATTDPVIQKLDLTIENIKAYITEGITYAEVKGMFGSSQQNISQHPIDQADRVWILGENGAENVRVEISFRHPGYSSFSQWEEEHVDRSKLPTEVLMDGTVVYTSDGDDLLTWFDGMEAVRARLYWLDGRETEYLFGAEYQDSPPTWPEVQPTTPSDIVINEQKLFGECLALANLSAEDVTEYRTELGLEPYTYYGLTMYTADYRYEFRLHHPSVKLFTMKREFIGCLPEASTGALTVEDAIAMAMKEPLVYAAADVAAAFQNEQDGTYTVCLVTDDCEYNYEYRGYQRDYQTKLEVLPEHNIILNLEITNRFSYGYRAEETDPDKISEGAAFEAVQEYADLRWYHMFYWSCNEIPDKNCYEVCICYEDTMRTYEVDVHSAEVIAIKEEPLSE